MWLYHASRMLLPPMRLYFKVRVFGGAQVPVSGPLLVAANHASYIDPWLLGGYFPRIPIRYLINEPWYRRSRTWRAVFRAYGVIPSVDHRPGETVRRVVDALGRGEIVGVFPEGRISRDGRIGRGRSGLGLMAAMSGAPVVPVGLRGNFEALPRTKWIPRPHPVELHIGEPLRFPGRHGAEPSLEDARAFVVQVMDAIVALSGREREGEQATRPRFRGNRHAP